MTLTHTTMTKPFNLKPDAPDVSHLPRLTPDHLPPYGDRHYTLMHTLHQALVVKRPHGSLCEASLAAWIARRFAVSFIDGAGNLHFDRRAGSKGEFSRTLFTAHTDTVHHHDGGNIVRVDGKFWRADGDVLGADDGAGIALLAHLMDNDVPGYYILFRGEERGGIGSTWLAENMDDLLREFDRAVAFDRAGYYDVITHQSGTRCCSDVFADALAGALSFEESGLMFMPSDGGVYTDTAEFVSLIPECTNVSVGYKAQHTHREEQDVEFLKQLADTLVLVQWETLPTQRDPRTRESLWGASGSYAWATPPTAATNQTWAALDAYYDEADLDELEPDQFDLLCALEEAREGDTSWLVTLVSDHLLPDGEHTLPLNLNRLDAQLIEDCINMLRQGFAAEMVAGEIHDALRID